MGSFQLRRPATLGLRTGSRAVSPAGWYWNHGRAPGGASNPWNPRPGSWSAAGRPTAGHLVGPWMWRCLEPGQRIPGVRSISPPQHRTDVGWLRPGYARHPRDLPAVAPGW